MISPATDPNRPANGYRWTDRELALCARINREIGRDEERAAVAADWAQMARGIKAVLDEPTLAEIVAARLAESKCICGRCSGCIRRENVEKNRARFGQDNYPGRE